eukprot:6207241-Pleurochrysis_carterae.AAC.2
MMSPAPLSTLFSPSTLLVTYHHHLYPNLQPPVMIISAVRFIWIRGKAISFMAIHMGLVIGGRVDWLMVLYALGFNIPFVPLSAYYHVSSPQSALILSVLSTPPPSIPHTGWWE